MEPRGYSRRASGAAEKTWRCNSCRQRRSSFEREASLIVAVRVSPGATVTRSAAATLDLPRFGGQIRAFVHGAKRAVVLDPTGLQ